MVLSVRPGRLFALAVALAGSVSLDAAQAQTPPKPAPAAADPHAQMHARGNHVMGFDQEKTAHAFLLFEDGGAIVVRVKDRADAANRDAIRSHLPHLAMLFGEGDFSAPALVHDRNVPGTKELAALRSRVSYRYVETDLGGRVEIVTTDRAALDAVHSFLRFQISDHKTADSGKVEKRR